MKISTNYLLRTMLRFCWIAVLAGLILAGGFWALRGRAPAPVSPEPDGQETAAQIDPETDPRLLRFALWQPDFSAYREEGTPDLGINEYAASVSAFAAARFQTDAACWAYYDALLKAYPGLDPFVFTSDDLRDMITVWPYNYDLVLRVTAPALDAAKLAHCVEALGAESEERALCCLRDTVFQAVCAVMDDPGRLADAGVTLRRADPAYEDMMQRQSIVAAQNEAELFAVKEGVLSGGEEAARPVGKKTLALVFLLGFALAEALIALIALFDPRVKNGEDLRLNTALPLLQTVPAGEAALTEAALRLGETPAPVLLHVNVSADGAEALPARLDAGRKAALPAPAGESASVHFDAKSMDWLISLRGRPVILAVQAMHTTYDDLKHAAEALSAARADVRGAVLLPAQKGTSKKG